MFFRVSRLFYTLWPLKPVQLWGLVYFRLIRKIISFKACSPEAKQWQSYDATFDRYQTETWSGELTFTFLNRTAGVSSTSWETSDENLLWHYNLQYLDTLWAVDSTKSPEEQAHVISTWWANHRNEQGIAWDAYPCSLRAVNPCKWGWQNSPSEHSIDEHEWIILLDRHYQEIKRKLEIELQANHLYANLKALWFLQAALPDYRVRDHKWLCRKLLHELKQQFDNSGGHFELSPMYHRIMLWDLLDMVVIGRELVEFHEVVHYIEQLLPNALRWMRALSHPDGDVAFFNDASIGIAPDQARLLAYARRLKIESLPLVDGKYSGYAVCQLGKAYVICDTAAIGPDFQPGHAHADTLSFELSIGKQRLLVNSGTSEYGTGSERIRQRSTSAHNTVCVSGKNSSDVWSGFRVGKKARIVSRQLKQSSEAFRLTAVHDGYRPVHHKRQWYFTKGRLEIQDSISGEGDCTAFFHLHPDINVTVRDQNTYQLEWTEGRATLTVVEEGAIPELQESTWHPAFGVTQNNQRLAVHFSSGACKVIIEW